MDREAVDQMRMLWGAYDDLPTFPETRITHGNTGHCHGWAGGPAHLLPAYVLGVSPTAGGWSEARFHPCPLTAGSAAGEFRTPRGPLRAWWRREDSCVRLGLTLPPAVTVTARLGKLHEHIQGPTTWETTCP